LPCNSSVPEHLYKTYNFSFPSADNLSYNNPLVGFYNNQYHGMNFVMANGETSQLPYRRAPANKYRKDALSSDVDISAIKMFGCNEEHELWGFCFYNKQGNLLLQAGYTNDGVHNGLTARTPLKEGERIVGVRSYTPSDRSPAHLRLVFLIGRLE
jgi:hypothetical protein